jgi:hypothetical protein
MNAAGTHPVCGLLPSRPMLRTVRRLLDGHTGLLVSAAMASLLWLATLPASAATEPPLRLLHLVPLLLAGVVVDVGRRRLKSRLNRARQQAFQCVARDRMQSEARLLQHLLVLRRQVRQNGSLDLSSQRALDELIVQHHRQITTLQQQYSDSDLMAPLITGVYRDDVERSTRGSPLPGTDTAGSNFR